MDNRPSTPNQEHLRCSHVSHYKYFKKNNDLRNSHTKLHFLYVEEQ